MIKKILILFVLCLFLFSCTPKNIQEEETGEEINLEEQKIGDIIESQIIITSSGLDLNEITTNVDDNLIIQVTNVDEDQMFFVENYGVEEYLAKGSSVIININLDKTGSFAFGNLMEAGKRGILIVK